MFSTQFDSSEDCGYVAKIINYLNSSDNFSLKDFKAVIRTLSNQATAVQEALQKPVVQPEIVSEQKSTTVQHNVTVPPLRPQPINPQPPKSVLPNVVEAEPVQVKKTEQQSETKNDKNNFGFFGRKKEKAEVVASTTHSGEQFGFAVPGMNEGKAEESSKVEKQKKGGFFGFGKKAIPGESEGKPKTDRNVSNTVQRPVPINSAPDKPPVTTANTGVGFVPAQNKTPDWKTPVGAGQYGATSVLNAGPIGQTTVLSQQVIGQTTVLNQVVVQKVTPYLYRKRTGEKIPLDKILFRVGTERSYVDYCVSDNSAVSHSHADIINHEGEFYIRDNNSTNHTFLNGQMIASNQEYKLENGAKIVLGNEEFSFHVQ